MRTILAPVLGATLSLVASLAAAQVAPADPAPATSPPQAAGSPAAAPPAAAAPATDPAASAAPPPAAAAAQERRNLTVGILADAPPFSSAGRFGTRTGFDVDIALALCSRLEADCTLMPYEADELAPAFAQRRVDFAVATLTPSRLDGLVDFTNPYVRIAARHVVPRNPGTAPGTDVWGVVAGSAQAEDIARLEPDRPVRLYASVEEMWIDLALGRLAGVLAPAITARRDFLSTPIGEPFRFGSAADANALARTAAVAIRQGNDRLRGEIDAALDDLLSAPEYDEILSRHLDPDLAGPPRTGA